MKKIVLAFFVGVTFASCNKDPQPLNKVEVSRRIDSLTQERILQSDEQAKADLDYRIKIEVKVKVDSILSARAAHPDGATVLAQRAVPAGVPFK